MPKEPTPAPVVQTGYRERREGDGITHEDSLTNRFAIAERLYNQIEKEIGGVQDFRGLVAVLNTWKNRENDLDKNFKPSPDMLKKIDSGLYLIISIIAPLAKDKDIDGLENALKYLVSSDTLDFNTAYGKNLELRNDGTSLGILEKIREILSYMLAKHYTSSRTDLDPFASSLEEEFKDMDGLA